MFKYKQRGEGWYIQILVNYLTLVFLKGHQSAKYLTVHLWVRFPGEGLLNQRVNTCNFACCCYSVAKLYPTLCNPMNCSMPGFPILYHLSAFPQTHVHWVGDAIQPSHSLWAPLGIYHQVKEVEKRKVIQKYDLLTKKIKEVSGVSELCQSSPNSNLTKLIMGQRRKKSEK